MRLAIPGFLCPALCLVLAVSAAPQSPMLKVRPLPVDVLATLSWTSLAADAKGDVLQPRLPDATELSYAVDVKNHVVWFKVNINGPVPERWFGINVAADTDGTADNGTPWWGTNKVKFDRLASAYLFDAGEYWQGYAGVADSDSAGRGYLSNVTRDVKVAVDRQDRAILLGIPRPALGTASTIRVMATVGSMLANNDDVPNEGMVTVSVDR